MTGTLSHAVTFVRRPSPNADLPFGAADLLWVTNTATLIFGKSDAILVDTFMTLDENRKLIEWVASFGRNLRYVYVTHGHVDHYYGVHQILGSFPSARAISNPESAARAREDSSPQRVQSQWNVMFPGQMDQNPTSPEPFAADHVELEGHRIQFVQTGFTDTQDSTAVWVPDLRLVVAGDAAYNNIHHWTAETTAESREQWARAAEQLAALNPVHVVAGHKDPDRDDSPQILAETAQYLRDFNSAATHSNTAIELYTAMLDKYPRRANPGALWVGAQAAKPSERR
jgi:glyoxylase-like metal-dependent hydrolase (beta-lactamase superfamily II)